MIVQDIADEIYRDLGSPDDISVDAVSFWVRGHIGDVNNLIHSSYILSSDYLEVEPEYGVNEVAIIKSLYNLYYYDSQIRANLGAASNSIVVDIQSDGANVRMVNKNEISKTWVTLRKEEAENLRKLVQGYVGGGASPSQVMSDRTSWSPYGSIFYPSDSSEGT